MRKITIEHRPHIFTYPFTISVDGVVYGCSRTKEGAENFKRVLENNFGED